MSDLISRQAAIDAFLTELTKRERTSLLHTWSTVEVKYFIAKILEQLPPAQPGWISVTERLPKKDGDYLVTTHSGQIARYIFIGGSSEEYWRRCATAWMPLPKPWEGENNG